MAAIKLNFLANRELQTKKEMRDDPIIDTKVIEYIINEFPTPTKDIRQSLVNLQVTLEKSIDFIEDKSSEIIKINRDFELSNKYRETCVRLHEISTSLNEYVKWMDVIGDKASLIENDKIKESTLDIYKPIYNDFTGLTPVRISLNNFSVDVENWDDLIMKTASMLTKNYKDNKESEIIFPEHNTVILKKSHENELRDTVIEMLSEYKISLNDYKIQVQ